MRGAGVLGLVGGGPCGHVYLVVRDTLACAGWSDVPREPMRMGRLSPTFGRIRISSGERQAAIGTQRMP